MPSSVTISPASSSVISGWACRSAHLTIVRNVATPRGFSIAAKNFSSSSLSPSASWSPIISLTPSRKITVRISRPSPNSTGISPFSRFAMDSFLYGVGRGHPEGHVGRDGAIPIDVALEALDEGAEGDRLHGARQDAPVPAQQLVRLVGADRAVRGVDPGVPVEAQRRLAVVRAAGDEFLVPVRRLVVGHLDL